MADLSKDEQFALNTIEFSLYDNFDISSGIIAGAKFVSSMDEAKTLAASDTLNRKYNKFNAFFFYYGKYFTSLEFSLYLDWNMDKIYILFNDIPNKILRLDDKVMPHLFAVLNYATFDEDLERFSDNVLTPALINYYADTKLDMREETCHVLFPVNGDLSGLRELMHGITGLKPVSGIVNVSDLLAKNLKRQSHLAYREHFLSPAKRFYVAESLSGTHHYIFADNFIWYGNGSIHEFLLEDKSNLRLLRLEV